MGKPTQPRPNSSRRGATAENQYKYWCIRIAIVSLLLILLYSLFPYDFLLINEFSLQSSLRQLSLDQITTLKDYIELVLNLVLYGLFSVGLSGVACKLNKISTLGITLISCTSLAIVTELLQPILPSRNANLQDVLMGSLGGLMGWFIFYLKGDLIVDRLFWLERLLHRQISPRRIAIAFISYSLLATIGTVILPTATDFRNWDSSYSLLLGNEFTGDRPWQGRIERVQFFDQALPPAAIAQLFADQLLTTLPSDSQVAAYNFINTSAPYVDQTGHLPDLVWNEPSSQPSLTTGVSLGSDHWLKTTTPATYLNQKIQQQHALTLDVIVQPLDLTQSGPARIVSLSQNTRRRNFTLGQEGQHLVVRLRTPQMGKNGDSPPVIVPQVFRDTTPQHLVVTYAHSTLQVFINNPQTVCTIRLPHPGYKLLHYIWVFLPLGYLLGLLWISKTTQSNILLLLTVAGVVMPSLLLEGILILSDRRSFILENIGMSLALMLGALVVSYHSHKRQLAKE